MQIWVHSILQTVHAYQKPHFTRLPEVTKPHHPILQSFAADLCKRGGRTWRGLQKHAEVLIYDPVASERLREQ
jgi:hypothetical protein